LVNLLQRKVTVRANERIAGSHLSGCDAGCHACCRNMSGHMRKQALRCEEGDCENQAAYECAAEYVAAEGMDQAEVLRGAWILVSVLSSEGGLHKARLVGAFRLDDERADVGGLSFRCAEHVAQLQSLNGAGVAELSPMLEVTEGKNGGVRAEVMGSRFVAEMMVPGARRSSPAPRLASSRGREVPHGAAVSGPKMRSGETLGGAMHGSLGATVA
jgi:hypothetical protein